MSSWPYVMAPERSPEPRVFRPRRAPWRTNNVAVGLVLAGALLVAAAVSLYGTGGMPDDIQSCPSLAAVDAVPAHLRGSCSVWRDDRAHVIRALGVAGLVVAVLGLATATRRWLSLGDDRAASWTALRWCAITPVVFLVLAAPTFPTSQANDGVATALGQVVVAGTVFVTWCCASARRVPTLRAHLLVASALAVPLVCLGTAVSETREWHDGGARFPYPSGFVPWLATGAATTALFAVAVVLARASRRPPNVWVAAALFLVSLAAVVVVFVPDLVPAWADVKGYDWQPPGPDIWRPILLAPAGLAVVVWAAHAFWRDPTAGPTRPAFS